MSEQQGPTEDLDVFNPGNFRGTGSGSQYVTYNTAQGLVIFPNGIQFGDGSVLTTADLSNIDISGVVNPMNAPLDANDLDINNVATLSVSNINLNTQSGALSTITVGSPITMNTNKITNVADPTSSQDAATKFYIDNSLTSYETIANAAATYETIANAAATYETIANAAATYAPINAPSFTGTLTVERNILLLEAGLSSTTKLLGNSAITAGNYLTTLNPGSTSSFALEQLSAGDNGSQSIIITSGGTFGQTKNTIQSYDSYRNSSLDLYLNPLGGNVFVPTPSTSDNSTRIATTAYVQNNLTSYETTANAAATYAPLVSPALTGTPTAPTQTSTDNSTKLATTAFVQSHVATGYAPINSPHFTGIPTAPTPATSTNTTQLATTAFVQTVVNNASEFQPFFFNSSGELPSSSGYVLSGSLTFNMSGGSSNDNGLAAVFLKINCQMSWNKITSGSTQYWNDYTSGEYFVTLYPGRWQTGVWGKLSTSSNPVYYMNNAGGQSVASPWTVSDGSNGQKGYYFSRTIYQVGSQISSTSLMYGSSNKCQFGQFSVGSEGEYSQQIQILGVNRYFKGSITYKPNDASPPTNGSGTNYSIVDYLPSITTS